MFGVFESPERTDQTGAETSSAFRPVIDQSREQLRQTSCGEVRPAPEQGLSLVKVNLPAQGGISDGMESVIVPSPALKLKSLCTESLLIDSLGFLFFSWCISLDF